MSIGENIKKARGRIKQIELAGMLGVDTATISRWENDRNTPNGQILTKIAETLNVPVSRLLSEEDKSEHTLMSLSQKVADATSEQGTPITAGRKNNMYIIKDGDREFCMPDNPTGQEIFLKLACSMFNGEKLSEALVNAKLNINNGTNSSYHDSIVNNGTSPITQIGMNEIA